MCKGIFSLGTCSTYTIYRLQDGKKIQKSGYFGSIRLAFAEKNNWFLSEVTQSSATDLMSLFRSDESSLVAHDAGPAKIGDLTICKMQSFLKNTLNFFSTVLVLQLHALNNSISRPVRISCRRVMLMWGQI